MDKVSKVKATPVILEPRPMTEGEAFNLHGQVITVVSNTSGSVQFDYAKGQRRNLQAVWLEQYHAHGAFPKGTLFTRLIDNELVTVKILSLADGQYDLDIECEDEDIDPGIESPAKFKALIKWHMQPEYEETSAAPPSLFPDRPGYTPDEDTPDYAAGVEAGRKAALAQVMEQSQEVSRLKHETDDFHETIAILRDELEAYKTANARLEAKGRIVNGQRYTYLADTHVPIPNVNQRCQTEGLEVCHFQYDATGLKLSVVYRKPVEPEPLPAPQPTYSSSVGNPTHGAGQGIPGITIIHKDEGERKGVPLIHNRALVEEPGKTKRIPHLQGQVAVPQSLVEANQEVAEAMLAAMQDRAKLYPVSAPTRLGGNHVIQTTP